MELETKLSDNDIELVLQTEAFVDGCIPKKAMLGNRNVEKVVVPKHVTEIGDWAFAHCKKLEVIYLPATLREVGRDAFLGCDVLSQIVVYDVEKENRSYVEAATLLAFAVRFFLYNSVFDFSGIGEMAWYQEYDKKLMEYIDTLDDAGFDPFLAGGEEDYEDPRNNKAYYCEMSRRNKCRVCLERLLFQQNIEPKVTERLMEYVSFKTEEVIALLLEMREGAIVYLKLCGDMKMINQETINRYLSAFSGEIYTECRAYLLQYKAQYLDDNNETIWNTFQL